MKAGRTKCLPKDPSPFSSFLLIGRLPFPDKMYKELRFINLGGAILPWAEEFDFWLKDALFEGRYEDVKNYKDKAPHAKMAHPWPEHIFPLHACSHGRCW
ncbi:Extradiol ring-cleavage dioxygenase, class III enzyme, subunit B [Corchorus olitorius]|uniref:Extradiol ring-cleavage dioxygenase, class III enzyme, subunit B n=1 Tax=Corchorus olitorius TaxID=93759 RepID=A0A1R3KKN8_9ROSI|nr:Extradiol ring-cleavage dioxygenase, class III enzyme, subunit B [Corchorus olitorius]